MKLRVILSLIAIFFAQHVIYAEEAAPAPSKTEDKQNALTDEGKHKKIIEDYKEFLTKIQPSVRDEIREYRKAAMQLNKQKIALYKKLSQEAQNVLVQERKFKSQLPINERKSAVAEVGKP